MFTRTKIAGLVMVVMALSAPMVYADSTQKAGDWHHGDSDKMMAKILNLTDDQQKQMKDSWEKQKTAMKSIFEQMKTNEEALDAEIVKTTLEMNKVNELQSQLKTIQSQMADNRLNSLLEIKKILTPEQFAGYMALKKEKMLKMHMMGHGKFGHKDEFGKDGDGHKNGSDSGKEKDEGDQD